MAGSHPTRREFAAALAAGAIGTALAGCAPRTAVPSAATAPAPDPTRAPSPPVGATPAPAPEPAEQQAARQLAAGALALLPGAARLTDAERGQVTGAVRRNLGLAGRLRAAVVPNGAGPFAALPTRPPRAAIMPPRRGAR